LPQRFVTIAVSLIGLVGGMALIFLDPPTTWPTFFLILAFAVFSLAILRNIPRIRAWVGGGHQLFAGIFLVFKSASGELETTFFRVTALLVGAALLVHLIVRGTISEWRRRRDPLPTAT
jgi:hypothetical protein